MPVPSQVESIDQSRQFHYQQIIRRMKYIAIYGDNLANLKMKSIQGVLGADPGSSSR